MAVLFSQAAKLGSELGGRSDVVGDLPHVEDPAIVVGHPQQHPAVPRRVLAGGEESDSLRRILGESNLPLLQLVTVNRGHVLLSVVIPTSNHWIAPFFVGGYF